MLIPLVGFIIACAIFACIGAAALALFPKLRPTPVNIAVFVLGAVPTSVASGVAYGRLFANEAHELTTPVAVVGFFLSLLAGGFCGGLVSVFACRWLMRVLRFHRNSGSPVGR